MLASLNGSNLHEAIYTYLGGKFVLGTGNSWPQDFLFFAGFFSSDLLSSSASSASRDVSAGETVRTGTSNDGVDGKESVKVSSILTGNDWSGSGFELTQYY